MAIQEIRSLLCGSPASKKESPEHSGDRASPSLSTWAYGDLPSARPTTSVIIVNFNGGNLLLDCIDSVRRFTSDYELLVIDNASSDGSIEKLRASESDVRIMSNPANYGFARANNVGLHASEGRYIVLLNPDTIVTKGWLQKLIRCAETDPHVGLATPKLLRVDGRIDSTGHVFWFERVDAKNRGEEEKDEGQYDERTELPSCDFSCALIKRMIFDEIGVLDQKIFFYHEDIDFCLRARLAGWRVIYCPSSVVYHRRGGSTSSNRRRVLAQQRKRYLLRLALKNYELGNVFRVFVGKCKDVSISLIGTIAGIKNGDVSYSKLRLAEILWFFDALLWNVFHLPVKERIAAQGRRKIRDSDLMSLSR